MQLMLTLMLMKIITKQQKTNGPRLLRNAHIQKQIKQIHEAKLKELAIEPLDLIEDVAKEAKGDIGNESVPKLLEISQY